MVFAKVVFFINSDYNEDGKWDGLDWYGFRENLMEEVGLNVHLKMTIPRKILNRLSNEQLIPFTRLQHFVFLFPFLPSENTGSRAGKLILASDFLGGERALDRRDTK